jgi:UDP-glucose 4-epimerase
MHTWVIGSGGLLGGALLQEFPEAFRGGPINWADASQSGRDLSENLSAFRALVSANPQPWLIVWAAGQATVSSDKETCLRELRVFTEFIGMLNEQLPEGPGTFFLTSSAGGVYAGSKQAPFSASSPVAPLSEYGSLKLQQETAATKLKGVRVMIGRVSNLYGPGQDLNKLQGLVSRLVKAGLDKETINIFVPLDTIRDFIFVQDAAATIAQVSQDSGSPNLLVIASGEPKSLGTGSGCASDQNPHCLWRARQWIESGIRPAHDSHRFEPPVYTLSRWGQIRDFGFTRPIAEPVILKPIP